MNQKTKEFKNLFEYYKFTKKDKKKQKDNIGYVS